VGLTTAPRKKIVEKPQAMKAGRIDCRRPSMYKCLRLGTWNVLSLYKCGALRNLISIIQEYKIYILAIQEVRWIGQNILEKEEGTILSYVRV
jgi:hypothetical protein